jgi:hypothetical protein
MGVADIKFGTVNIYCSLLVTIMVIKYFFNKMISKKEKIVTAIFIAFFLLSISFNLIDYFWHLMQRPIWYPNRYIFTFSFFLIVIAYKSFKYREHVNMYWLVKSLSTAVPILSANRTIAIDRPDRDYIWQQALARTNRRGQDTDCDCIVPLLDTGDADNITTRSGDILSWSKEQVEAMTSLTLNLEDEAIMFDGYHAGATNVHQMTIPFLNALKSLLSLKK